MRESIRRFVINELAAARRGVGGDDLSDWVFTRMGELGFLGLDKPEAYGGQGGDFSRAWCWPRRCRTRTAAACRWASGPDRHGDAADSRVRHRRAEAGSGRHPRSPARRSSAIGITEPDAGSDVAGIKTRAVRDEATGDYVINGSKTYITNGHRAHAIVLVTKTDPEAGRRMTRTTSDKAEPVAERSSYEGFTLFIVPMDAPGVVREKRLKKLGMHASDTALLAFQDVRVPETAVLGQLGQGLLPHHVGAPGRAADRRRGQPSRAPNRCSIAR